MRLSSALLPVILAAGLAGAAHGGPLDAKRAASASVRTPVEDQRGTEQTFLTFPEWFLVHSPAEYAAYVRSHTPSAFPFLGHVRQFWQSYATVSAAANDGYPFNFGYHVMILVIGSSTTLEYILRSAYENLVGRLSEATQDGGPTPEDAYAARVAQAYVDFIRVKPWYEFDFFGRLAGLWRDTPLTGPDAIRKWERKYALTTEYAIKGAYGWLIGLATEAGYDPAGETTVVVLDRMPDDLAGSTLVKLKVLTPAKPLYHGEVLASLPRYQAFTDTASALAFQGVEFQEIAGNRGPILLSVITDRVAGTSWGDAKVLFEQPILSEPGKTRVALVVPVGKLSGVLRGLSAQGVVLEHVYDY